MSIVVNDPPGALGDPAMPMLRLALQPAYMARRLQDCLSVGRALANVDDPIQLRAIHVRRHKPGRRCLIEYALTYPEPNGSATRLTVLGKVRAKGLDRRSHAVQDALWRNGFGPSSEDRIGVPEPLGVLPDLAMWLQRRISGQPVTEPLTGPKGSALAVRIAGALHKLQRRGVPAGRRHTLADELVILRRQLGGVIETHPAWAVRIGRVLAASERLGATIAPGRFAPSHRDFYPDNLLVDGEWLHLIDLDLYCEADPALDMGNFIGHVTEFSLRTRHDPKALVDLEQTLEEAFVRLVGVGSRAAVRAYATLTLVRHIAISTRIPGRCDWTPALLDLCEQRLGIAAR
ncbi:MAG: phosphotransferase [Thiocapsa sp.]|uniref:phosphotransferase n=1 Tax=Thiocapsa sp. TaxID=2024551 RepID=UPI001BCCF52D|nr:phosphotransferase [Thiocapsa sp.]QVL49730.1 MAG: phosphotransferase [Thiocapsa sp.]